MDRPDPIPEADGGESGEAGSAAADLAMVFVVSARYRRELATAVEASSRAVHSVRRPDEAARRFGQSPALIAVIDARGALGSGLATARSLSRAVEERRGAMLMLLSRGDGAALAEVHAAGATHFLVSPFTDGEFAQTLRFADRYIRRIRLSGANEALVSAQAALSGGARWEWRRGEDEVDLSPELAALIGEPSLRRLNALTAIQRVARGERSKVAYALRRLLLTGTSGEVDHVAEVDGATHRLVHHVRLMHGPDGEVAGLTATVEDIDALLLDRRLARHFDALTGLANQSYAHQWVEERLTAPGDGAACIVVLLSVSRFDRINASYGRSVADALLHAVARRLRRIVDEQDGGDRVLTARMAGAEFAVACGAPADLAGAVALAKRFGAAFEQPFVAGGRAIHLACRMGIASGDAATGDAETLFRQASAALAQAKTAAPNGFQLFTPGALNDAANQLASLETDLRRALDEDELDILFQPQVEIVSGRITGAEALVRWAHPLLGRLPAETLLAVAARAELSSRVGEHIVARALATAAAWPPHLGGMRLSVNVTAEDVQRPDFAAMIERLVAESGFPHERLTLEVTESGLVENLEAAAVALAEVRGSGLRVAIDDFGTGYSSLAYLQALPLDYLKVDRSLITDIGGSARDRVVVDGVVDMARSLGLGVIAEGVETAGQLDRLVGAGCNWYQGFLCAPPMSAADLPDFVAEWNAPQDSPLLGD